MRRILVIRTGAIGDCILTFPVLSALRRIWPDADLHVMGAPSILDLAIHAGYAQACFSIDRSDMAPLFIRDAALPASITDFISRYDLVLSYLPDLDGVFRENLRRIGVPHCAMIAPRPPADVRYHITHHLMQILHPFGIVRRATSPHVRPSGEDRDQAAMWLTNNGLQPEQPIAVVHPGSGGRNKCWPVERFSRVINELVIRGVQTVVTSGPADREVIGGIRNQRSTKGPVYAENIPLPLLAGMLTYCRFMLGNDTGITHLAAAVGIPTIGLFGPTDPAVWGPRGEGVRILWGKDEISGDIGDMEPPPLSDQDLQSISVDRVLRAVDEIMTASSIVPPPTG